MEIPVKRNPYASEVLSFFEAATKRVIAFWIPDAQIECTNIMTGDTRPKIPRLSSVNTLDKKIL